ncbi:MAG TPA: hypothetical protein V6C99_08475 [Oculatellaceae cyanobacterium]|jgi:hypothetical protein
MPQPNNVLKFPHKNPLQGFHLKAFAVVFYLFIAAMLTQVLQANEEGLFFLVLLGILYHFGIRQFGISRQYFRQNGVLLIILFLLALFVFSHALIPIIAISIVYWLLIRRTAKEAPYFIRYHILTALVLNFLVVVGFLLVSASLELLNQIFLLFHFQPFFLPAIAYYKLLILWGLLWGVAIWLSGAALLGRTPYIGIVTNSIRHWI